MTCDEDVSSAAFCWDFEERQKVPQGSASVCAEVLVDFKLLFSLNYSLSVGFYKRNNWYTVNKLWLLPLTRYCDFTKAARRDIDSEVS